MTESITREEAEGRLIDAHYSDPTLCWTLDALFPPKPTFKKGEVIAVRGHMTAGWCYRKFKKITEGGRYRCELDSDPNEMLDWKLARPQTDEEKGNQTTS